MHDEKTPRQLAIEQGLKRYNTGKPCKNGHYSDRNVATSLCLRCNRNRTREMRDKLHEKAIERAVGGFVTIDISCHREVVATVQQFAKIASATVYDPAHSNDLEIIRAVLESLKLIP